MQKIVIALWSEHSCLGSGTADLSLCHDGSPTRNRVLCAWPSMSSNKGKITNEYPFTLLAHLLLHIKKNGIPQWIQCSLNGLSFNTHKGRTHEHTQKVQTNSRTIDTLLFTQGSDLFRQGSRRKSWKANKCIENWASFMTIHWPVRVVLAKETCVRAMLRKLRLVDRKVRDTSQI